jgi:uncharacterized protein (DUF433 family)
MRTVQKSLRVPVEVVQAVQETAKAAGQDFSTMASELLTEAVKMRRCPGVLFADGPGGRRARVAGTGIEVWEVIATYRSVHRSLRRLQRTYHWLSEPQLRAALGYYEAYPEEIEQQIARNETWTKKRLAQQHPAFVLDRR